VAWIDVAPIAIGQAVREFHLQNGKRYSAGLRAVDAGDAAGQAYLSDVHWSRRYAAASRRAMVETVTDLMRREFAIETNYASFFQCDHNHVIHEEHDGQLLWVHRKGAIRAGEGEPGIIPGSMGTESFHTSGRGCAASLCSSSHGAGRVMSRDEARRRITLKDLDRQLDGVWVDPHARSALRDEAPSAYKNIREVFRAQKKLTRIQRRLRPVLCYKGGR
jgi:tRNA-splicing ligase RtcB